VIITAGQQTLFRGDAPTILRGLSQDGLDWLSSHVTISEFRNGLMLMSGTNSFPIGYSLPERVKSAFDDPGRTSLWADETIDGTRYETYYARRAGGTGEIVALSLPDLGFRRYLMGVVRLLVFFSLVLLIVVALLPLRWLRGRHRRLTFRDRLLVALLVTACVPLALLILYGRLTAAQRLFDRTSQSLDDQTWSVATSLKDQMESTGRDDIYSVRPAVAEAIATDLGTDFNLYAGDDLMLSTRPELYEIGILDRRISGSAFAGVALRGRRFHVERENIGQYDYIVGYRPVLDNAGGIIGIVSVPTLYRQDDVEEELTLRNAILFGMYALVFISILIIATVFANRIASPIQRLTEATRSVAAGDLDVRLNMPAVDGEIGDLVSSFDRMTKDLRRSREELVRFERDLAWKEMAKQVAHEIKNPLTPMKLAVQHLRQTYKDRVTDFDEVMTTVTKTIIEQIDTLSRIASEFSHFARMPKRQLEHCDVNEVVQESVRLFDQHAGIRFNLVTTPALPPVVADREELRRAFINIIRNGIQAMDGSGTIGIRTDHVPEGVRIEIADAGGGIPDEVRAKLFQPNFSTKTDGMGLGLAIVKQTVDDLAGTIAIESASGAGTRVTIILPPAEG
jgi:signal transduction histidine kinase